MFEVEGDPRLERAWSGLPEGGGVVVEGVGGGLGGRAGGGEPACGEDAEGLGGWEALVVFRDSDCVDGSALCEGDGCGVAWGIWGRCGAVEGVVGSEIVLGFDFHVAVGEALEGGFCDELGLEEESELGDGGFEA